MNGDVEPLGKRWIQHFIQRNPRVASVIERKLDTSRAKAATLEQICAFLKLFKRVRIRLGVQTENI
ncbi:hypothetical protein K458DRAFT_207200 [Lentithecium fluviatile CBS 122367]|uniref:HTH CENPB-type domain-containing protein n=1 Tax=Lentithecium fluviatile CBS 122367 TaxID=1168545 RepID=A0A6G1J620_9PLEO|nr:hypothetical protein K458DRAFT_207200 [Lentithecium fluviatile CBS 122367]